MGKIVKLDENLSNKIAAGEVVERPASIVKELMENCIDANSTTIHVEVEEGGLQLIRIIDNGDGIDPDDSLIAFERHATSKIKTDKDLFRIRTLGFRGEALPSIASVSHLELKTCTGNGAGTHLLLEGGKIIKHGSAQSRKGTEITVTNLFYNTPARLKYLKTVHTELGNITDFVYRLALAHPNIAIRLDHNGKKVFSSSGNGDLKQVVASIYGLNIAKQMIFIENSSLDFRVSGYVCKPEVTRASRQYMSIFINDRFIKNYPLTKAIQDGYHTLLPIGRYPIAVLQIEMDPSLIDVNVHPAKLEVRLSKETELNQLVTETILGAFKNVQLIPEIKKIQTEKMQSEQLNLNLEHHLKSASLPSSTSVLTQQKEIIEEQSEESIETIDTEYENVIKETVECDIEEEIKSVPTTQNRVPVLYPIGQMHGTYILAQNENGLYIIDQHAAQERVNYEYFRKKVAEDNKQLQDLLVPLTFEFTSSESNQLTSYEKDLNRLGIFLEPFGSNSFIVRSHPNWFPKGSEKDIIEEIIEKVLTGNKVTIATLREETAILMSCKAAIKANRYLRNDEIFSLLETLRKCEDPFTCPHGRPILIHFTTYEMEKMFKRVM